MKIAIACWNDRVAPIFDNARQVHLVESESGKVLSEQRILLQDNAPGLNASLLSENGVSTLVCGAISRPVQRMVAERGIKVIPFISGGLQEVLQACLNKQPLEAQFAMPGCCGRRRHGQGKGNGMGMGKGFGQGRGMRGACLTDSERVADSMQQTIGRVRGFGNGRGAGGERGMGGGRGGRRSGNSF